MEWYMRQDGKEMIVPQDQERSEQSLSHDNSYQWEEGLRMCGELPDTDFSMWDSETKLVGDWQDYQLDGLSVMDQMNDNFMYEPKLDSILAKGSRVTSTNQSVAILPESECTKTPFDGFATDMGMNSQSSSQAQSSRGNFTYLEVPSSTTDWDKLEGSPYYSPYDSKKSESSLTRNVQVSETNPSIETDEEKCLEEVAIQELEGAITQLTDETRICFRDTLYRLAKSSHKQKLESRNQRGQHTLSKTPTSRFNKADHVMELETNCFERTVAQLMFHELNSPTPDPYHGYDENQLQQSCYVSAAYNQYYWDPMQQILPRVFVN